MKILKYIKYLIFILLIVSISIFGVSYLLPNKAQSVTIENQIEVELLTKNSQMEVPKQYTTYTSEIRFMENDFKGIQTVYYTHAFEKNVDEILVKLYINEIEEEKEYIYLTKVLVNGEKLDFIQKGQNAWIKLKKPLENMESISIGMEFEGRLKEEYGGTYVANLIPQIGVFDVFNGWAEQNYDIEEKCYLEVADYKITTIVPENVLPVCTGSLIEKNNMGNGDIKYSYEAKKVRGMSIYLNKNLKEHHLETETGMKLTVYSNRLREKELLCLRIQEVFDYYANIFGKYPYNQFVIIDIPGQEKSLTAPQMLVIDLEKGDTYDEQMYAAIGKQWLPYIIGHEPKEDIALNVGLEAYLSKRRMNSIETMKKYLNQYTYNQGTKTEDVYEENTYEEASYKEAYIEPMMFFLEIEDTIGTLAWESFLKQYYKEKAFKISSYNEFMAILLKGDKGNNQWLLNEYTQIMTNRKEETK